jgi:hypothetical protein
VNRLSVTIKRRHGAKKWLCGGFMALFYIGQSLIPSEKGIEAGLKKYSHAWVVALGVDDRYIKIRWDGKTDTRYYHAGKPVRLVLQQSYFQPADVRERVIDKDCLF